MQGTGGLCLAEGGVGHLGPLVGYSARESSFRHADNSRPDQSREDPHGR